MEIPKLKLRKVEQDRERRKGGVAWASRSGASFAARGGGSFAGGGAGAGLPGWLSGLLSTLAAPSFLPTLLLFGVSVAAGGFGLGIFTAPAEDLFKGSSGGMPFDQRTSGGRRERGYARGDGSEKGSLTKIMPDDTGSQEPFSPESDGTTIGAPTDAVGGPEEAATGEGGGPGGEFGAGKGFGANIPAATLSGSRFGQTSFAGGAGGAGGAGITSALARGIGHGSGLGNGLGGGSGSGSGGAGKMGARALGRASTGRLSRSGKGNSLSSRNIARSLRGRGPKFAIGQLRKASAYGNAANRAAGAEDASRANSRSFDGGNRISGGGIGTGTPGVTAPAGTTGGPTGGPNGPLDPDKKIPPTDDTKDDPNACPAGQAVLADGACGKIDEPKGKEIKTDWEAWLERAKALMLVVAILGASIMILQRFPPWGTATALVLRKIMGVLGIAIAAIGIKILSMGEALHGSILTALGAIIAVVAFSPAPGAASKPGELTEGALGKSGATDLVNRNFQFRFSPYNNPGMWV